MLAGRWTDVTRVIGFYFSANMQTRLKCLECSNMDTVSLEKKPVGWKSSAILSVDITYVWGGLSCLTDNATTGVRTAVLRKTQVLCGVTLGRGVCGLRRLEGSYCEEREKKPTRCNNQMFIINTASTCFGHHYAHLQENKDRVLLHTVCCAGCAGCGW